MLHLPFKLSPTGRAERPKINRPAPAPAPAPAPVIEPEENVSHMITDDNVLDLLDNQRVLSFLPHLGPAFSGWKPKKPCPREEERREYAKVLRRMLRHMKPKRRRLLKKALRVRRLTFSLEGGPAETI